MEDSFTIPEESEQLDQLQPEDSLIDRGVDDVLDEGYVAPDNWSPAQGFGNTAAEMAAGETIEMRIRQEIPERGDSEKDWNPAKEDRQVGAVRAGRLVDARGGFPGADEESEVFGFDVGRAGGAASAEEAAMHIIEEGSDEIIE